MQEDLKEVPGFGGLYFANKHGEIISVAKKCYGAQTRPRVLKLVKRFTEPTVSISMEGNQHKIKVKDLVCWAFHGRRDEEIVQKDNYILNVKSDNICYKSDLEVRNA